MPESFPTAMLWLLTGLVVGVGVGVGVGYFWRSDSQSPSATTQQHAAIETTHSDQPHAAGLATTIAAAISNPTGLQLVGTLVQPQHSTANPRHGYYPWARTQH